MKKKAKCCDYHPLDLGVKEVKCLQCGGIMRFHRPHEALATYEKDKIMILEHNLDQANREILRLRDQLYSFSHRGLTH